jgi:macrolide phosphotransferase
VLESYRKYRKDPVDPHLMRRAALAAEFALAQWLVRGLAADDQTMVDEAVEMLNELESDVAEHGGQPISVTAPPPPAAPPTLPAAALGAPEPETAAGPAAEALAGKPADGRSMDAVTEKAETSGSDDDSAADGPRPTSADNPRVHLSSGSGQRKVTLLPVEDPAADSVASTAPTGSPASQAPGSQTPVSQAGNGPDNNSPDRTESADGAGAPGTGPASVDTTALPVINQQ